MKKGQKVPEEVKLRMRESALKRISERPWSNPAGWNKGLKTGLTPGNIKEKPSYSAIHHWVKYHLGRPGKCENCQATGLLRFEWANLSGEYKRDLTDWASLCVQCHRLIDDTGRKSWASRRKII